MWPKRKLNIAVNHSESYTYKFIMHYFICNSNLKKIILKKEHIKSENLYVLCRYINKYIYKSYDILNLIIIIMITHVRQTMVIIYNIIILFI